jgi:hypothetical protein
MTESQTIQSREVTEADLQGFSAILGLDRVAHGRCSRLFLFELYARHLAPIPGDPVKIAHEVASLEGQGAPSRMKLADQFERLPLKGFWKQHYLVGGLASMAENIRLGFGPKKRDLKRLIQAHHNPDTAGLPPEVIAKNLADAVSSLYLQRARAQSLTGEWIVFARRTGQNYYLCLGSHGDDDAIRKKICDVCASEFPFILNGDYPGLI